MDKQTSKISVPWGAWNGDRRLQLGSHHKWQVKTYAMHDAPGLDTEQIIEKLEQPIATKPLAKLLAGKERIAIAVDDLSRPTPTAQILEHLLELLDEAGVPDDAITIIISLGTHTKLNWKQLQKKLGDAIPESVRVLNHDCTAELTEIGTKVGKTDVRLNSAFVDADFRMLIGSVVPHHFAGFSGGAKMVLPGLSNLESIEWTHKAVMMGLRSKPGTLENNRFRAEFERVAQHVGIDFCINVVVNSQREIAGLFCGDLIEAHQQAAAFAKKVYATDVVHGLDVAILNSYPKDTELLQAENAFMYLHTVGEGLVREGGTIIVASACSEGMGKHGLFEPETGTLFRQPMPKRFLGNHNVIFFVPGVTEEEFYQVFWEGYYYANDWLEVTQKIDHLHGDDCRVGVFPHASIQIAKESA